VAFSGRTVGVVEIVTVYRKGFQKVWVMIHDKTDGVTSIVVNEAPYGIFFENTATFEQIAPVSVQKCNVPVYSAAETHFQAFNNVLACTLGIDPRRKLCLQLLTLLNTSEPCREVGTDESAVVCRFQTKIQQKLADQFP
jgi:hypothetical protein